MGARLKPQDLNRKVRYGRKTLKYRLEFSERTTLGIEVHPDLSIVAKAPEGSELDRVDEKIHKRAAWILRQQSDFQNLLPILPPHQYRSGESFRYLGRQYKLRTFKAKHEAVRMLRGQLQVSLPNRGDVQRIQQLLEIWFRNRAIQVFDELWPECLQKVSRSGIAGTGYQLRKMKTRWGSCGKNGTILLNPELITASKSQIQYVMIHELCHLKHFNHGIQFFELLETLVPDWKLQREKLNRDVRGTG